MKKASLALSAILNVETDRTPYLESFNHFADLQSSNGSLNDDVYLTALALRVLDAAAKPAPDDIALSGRVVDGDTGAPLSGALIQLSGAASDSYVSDASGEFQLNNLTAGGLQPSCPNSCVEAVCLLNSISCNFPGLSETVPMTSQFRISPDQRLGFRLSARL